MVDITVVMIGISICTKLMTLPIPIISEPMPDINFPPTRSTGAIAATTAITTAMTVLTVGDSALNFSIRLCRNKAAFSIYGANTSPI